MLGNASRGGAKGNENADGLILRTRQLTVYFRSRGIFLRSLTQFLNCAFSWIIKDTWCLAVWAAMISLYFRSEQFTMTEPLKAGSLPWADAWFHIFSLFQTLYGNCYCLTHIVRQAVPALGCLLTKPFFFLLPSIACVYNKICFFFFFFGMETCTHIGQKLWFSC